MTIKAIKEKNIYIDLNLESLVRSPCCHPQHEMRSPKVKGKI